MIECEGGAATCFADTNANAEDHELPSVLGHALQSRKGAPDGQCGRDQVAPISAIRDARNRNAHERVEHSEGKARKQPHEGIGDAEIALYRLDEDAENLTVDEVEGVGDNEYPEDVATRRVAEAPG